MTILFCAAHPDDCVLSAGGTIAKLAKEGKKVALVIFSYGEGSDPLKEPQAATIQRIKEAKRAFDVLGVHDTIFLSLSDLNFVAEIKDPSTSKKFEDVLAKYNPTQIYAPSIGDPNSTHSSVSAFVREQIAKLQKKPEMYEFLVTPLFKLARRSEPRIYIDVSETIMLKRAALELFKSLRPYISIYKTVRQLNNWIAGFKSGTKYAEVFYKV